MLDIALTWIGWQKDSHCQSLGPGGNYNVQLHWCTTWYACYIIPSAKTVICLSNNNFQET